MDICTPHLRPGSWNDADMLEVGNNGLNVAEARSQFALWCLVKVGGWVGGCCRDLIVAIAVPFVAVVLFLLLLLLLLSLLLLLEMKPLLSWCAVVVIVIEIIFVWKETMWIRCSFSLFSFGFVCLVGWFPWPLFLYVSPVTFADRV